MNFIKLNIFIFVVVIIIAVLLQVQLVLDWEKHSDSDFLIHSTMLICYRKNAQHL